MHRKWRKPIDGYSGFLFYDDNGRPLVAMHWQHRFNHMVGRYNDIYRVQMPNITPHVCRHTYCSNMAKSGMNPKTLQYLMGHSLSHCFFSYQNTTFMQPYSILLYILNSPFSIEKTLQLKLERQLFSKLNYLKHLLQHRFLFLLLNLRLCLPKLFHSFQFFLSVIESDMCVPIHYDRYIRYPNAP